MAYFATAEMCVRELWHNTKDDSVMTAFQ